MKPAKRSSELKSRTGSSLMGRSNSFATLLRAEARGFAQVFFAERQLPPPAPSAYLQLPGALRGHPAHPRSPPAPRGCVEAPRLSAKYPFGACPRTSPLRDPPRTRCTRVHIPAGDLQQPHGRGWVSGAGCSPRGQRQSWLWGLSGPPKGEGVPGWLGFTGAVKKKKRGWGQKINFRRLRFK